MLLISPQHKHLAHTEREGEGEGDREGEGEKDRTLLDV